jgi:hypothetical protein
VLELVLLIRVKKTRERERVMVVQVNGDVLLSAVMQVEIEDGLDWLVA